MSKTGRTAGRVGRTLERARHPMLKLYASLGLVPALAYLIGFAGACRDYYGIQMCGEPTWEPCDNDTECVDLNGDGWYCDQDYVHEDDCGDTWDWPTCVEELPGDDDDSAIAE